MKDSQSKKNGNNDKKIGYNVSNLDLNKQTVCNYNEWTASVIIKRGDILAKYAYEIWDLRRQ